MPSARLLRLTKHLSLSSSKCSAILYPRHSRTAWHPGFSTTGAAVVPPPRSRTFFSSSPRYEYHFDTHKFVERLESEGLNRAQAEGIMTAMAEVIDESIRSLTQNMVTKAEQEKVRSRSRFGARRRAVEQSLCGLVGSVYPEGRLCPTQN
jgi:hypothetical protein